jgi:hypothetical protein
MAFGIVCALQLSVSCPAHLCFTSHIHVQQPYLFALLVLRYMAALAGCHRRRPAKPIRLESKMGLRKR